MSDSSLTALSPIDGRYYSQAESLAPFFSESALMKYRVRVEIEYFIALSNVPLPQLSGIEESHWDSLRSIYQAFDATDAKRIKELEQTTNHDVKAVEYFIKDKIDELGLAEYREFIHFGLTSQDINNTAIPLSLQEALNDVVLPKLSEVNQALADCADNWKDVPMLARTHGQPASPTRLGKEINVFRSRVNHQMEMLKNIPYSAKFGGATGNFNAHFATYPDVDWHAFGTSFVEGLGLSRSQPTTQIEHYDNLAALCDNHRRINTILIDLCRDVWQYVSMDYFKQRINENETGSSAMPHKVNPIDFENAEGNLGMANAVLGHFSEKLPISRLQRDLTDSTVLRNLGVPFAHMVIAFNSILKGLGKLELNREALEKDLENNWSVIAEGVQNILRREGYPKPFEALKSLTRTNSAITRESMQTFIDGLDVSDEVKEELKALTPATYVGR